MGRLDGKVALITGAAAGIGAATARLFCQEGACVVLVDMDRQALSSTAASLPAANVCTLAADVSDASAAEHAVGLANQRFGRLDILVNNAARRNYSPLAEASEEEWQAMLSVNLMGLANYCRAALPALRESGRGSIVNVSSCYAMTGRRGMGIYDTTKAGQLAFTRSLAHEEAEYGIRANAVCPGSTLTDFHVRRAEAAGKPLEQLKGERQTTSLLGRWASPEEIAWPILWLASDEASFITGTALTVDGGLTAM